MSTETPGGVGIVPAHLTSATVVLRWSDDKERTFNFDTLDQGIGLEYDVEIDVEDATPPDGTYRVMVPGKRQRMRFEIAGRGPIPTPTTSVAEPMPEAVEGCSCLTEATPLDADGSTYEYRRIPSGDCAVHGPEPKPKHGYRSANGARTETTGSSPSSPVLVQGQGPAQ